jgi:hypothetical protein
VALWLWDKAHKFPTQLQILTRSRFRRKFSFTKLARLPTFTLVHQIDAKSHLQNLGSSPFDAAAGARAWNTCPSFPITTCSKIQAIIMRCFARYRRLKLLFRLYSMSPFLELFGEVNSSAHGQLPPTAIPRTTDIHKKHR